VQRRRPLTELDGFGLKASGQMSGAALGDRQAGLCQDHCEFVPPDAGHKIVVRNLRSEPFSDRAKGLISRHVAKTVIDVLEVVKVEVDQNCRGSVLVADGPNSVELPDKGAAIDRRGQGVLVRQGLNPQKLGLQALNLVPKVVDLRQEGPDSALD